MSGIVQLYKNYKIGEILLQLDLDNIIIKIKTYTKGEEIDGLQNKANDD